MSDDIQELLRDLQKTYLASIPEKIQAIQILFEANQLKLLKTDFHKLKGTGRTYGLPEVTQIGEAMEQIVASANPGDIHEAVPLSMQLLGDIAQLRALGELPKIEESPAFIRIVEILTAQHGPNGTGQKTA